jgi:CubicO group peptidase (beta-lactamase class C family)
MILRTFPLAILMFGWMPLVALAETPARSLAPDKVAAIEAAVAGEMEKQGIVGAAVGIIEGGEIVFLQGFGQADREKSLPVTVDTVFNWASNSKPLAAVAAMQLVEKELLDLDADVREYVPEFPDKGTKITCRHILCHQSGIPHYSNGKVEGTTREYDTKLPFLDAVLALDTFNRSPLIFQPGEKVAYSSHAYILLSAAIQRAGKQPFHAQIEERIARPLGLKSLQLDVETNGQPNWSVGYIKDESGQVQPAEEDANYWKHGAGGYKSDIQDFVRWAQALINRRLLSEEGEKRLWSHQSTAAGERTTWGLGFTLEEQGGLKVSHGGKQDEATSRLVIYPRDKQGMVVMTNCGFADTSAISTAVYKAMDQK